MDIYLACFDIENDKARRRVSRLLLTYGERVQYSVFEIIVKNDAMLSDIKRNCQKEIDIEDSVRFYFLPVVARRRSHDVWDEPIAHFPQAIVL